MILGDAASKAALLSVLGGDRTPAILFTATHGMQFNSDDPRLLAHQGALVCQDWPGPLLWRNPIPERFYLSRDDVASDAKVRGLFAFFFACFEPGSPRIDDFGYLSKDRIFAPVAPHALVAALPRRLLGVPGGGALAVVGHIDRAWPTSFLWGRAGEQLDTYQSTLIQLMNGLPIGAALDVLNLFYASIAVMLVNEIDDVNHGKIPDDSTLAGLWMASNDARNFVLLGDPAVRLPSAG